MLKTAAATAAFALLHSALASRRAKRVAAGVVGKDARDGAYRALYVAQSVLTFGLLTAYVAAQPARTIYRVRGVGSAALRLGQLGGVALALAAAREVGVLRLAGVSPLVGWLRGRSDDAPPAVAQGPELDADGRLTTGGPFRWSRHPLNLSPLPVFWLTPHLTTRRLAFNLVATAYLVAGSAHEEARLRAEYGERYARYQRSGVPFFLPVPPLLPRT